MPTDPRELVLAELRKQTELLGAILMALNERRTITPKDGAAVANAIPDRLLEGQYGDPIVKAKSPKDWMGDDMTGKRFSECPPAYLDLVADRCEYFITKNTDALKGVTDDDEEAKLRKDIKYGTLDRDRAIGWAARLRSGWQPPASTGGFSDEQPGF